LCAAVNLRSPPNPSPENFPSHNITTAAAMAIKPMPMFCAPDLVGADVELDVLLPAALELVGEADTGADVIGFRMSGVARKCWTRLDGPHTWGDDDGIRLGAFEGTLDVGVLDGVLAKTGALDGTLVGFLDGALEGARDGVLLGTRVGALEGSRVGLLLGACRLVGVLLGALVGFVGDLDGCFEVGLLLGALLGDSVWASVSTCTLVWPKAVQKEFIVTVEPR